MRMVEIVVLAFGATFASVAVSDAAGLEPSCPNTLLIESTNARFYVAVFEAAVPTKVAFDLKFYTKDAAYETASTPVDIAKPFGGAHRFRSLPVIIKNPGNDEFLGATVTSANCAAQNVIVPSVASLTAPDRHIDPTTDALESQLESETASDPTIVTPTPAADNPPACKDAFADARAETQAKPAFPPGVRLDAGTPPAAVRVFLSPAGVVTGARIETSSGNDAIDAIFLNAAKQSTYHPERFACRPEAASLVVHFDAAK